MKKWRLYILASASVIAVAIVIYWKAKTCEARANECISSFAMLGKANKASAPNEAIQSCRESQGYFCRVLSPANIPNVGLFFVGVGAVLAGLLTLGAIRRQADIMDTSLRVVEAADVSIQSASLIPVGPITPDSHIALSLKNFGRTQAKNVKSAIVIIIPGVPDSEPSPETFSISPGGTQTVRFLNFRDFLNETTFQEIQSGTTPVKFSGNVTYEDLFKGSHIIPCKGVLNPHTGMFTLGDSYPGQKKQKENPN